MDFRKDEKKIEVLGSSSVKEKDLLTAYPVKDKRPRLEVPNQAASKIIICDGVSCIVMCEIAQP